jgi:catechol 2,3-dioxygenase-like lactoylglutathione lyase family enzyme
LPCASVGGRCLIIYNQNREETVTAGEAAMAARIGYLAILSHTPDKLAGFYTGHLGFKELGRSAAGDVSITDGSFNVTVFRHRKELNELNMEIGHHHIGIAVDSIAAVEARYRKFNPRGEFIRQAGDLQHGEARIFDPECHPVTLSERNFGLGTLKAGLPRIAHISIGALDPSALYEFYDAVFGFRELFDAHAESSKRPGYKNRHVGDGATNIALQAIYPAREGHEGRHGVAHIGLVVNDADALAEQVKDVATIAHRPGTRTQSEIRMRDPEGNGCDLSRRGWEVDVDKWASSDAA